MNSFFLRLLLAHLFWTSDYTHQPGSHRRKATQEVFLFFVSEYKYLLYNPIERAGLRG